MARGKVAISLCCHFFGIEYFLKNWSDFYSLTIALILFMINYEQLLYIPTQESPTGIENPNTNKINCVNLNKK